MGMADESESTAEALLRSEKRREQWAREYTKLRSEKECLEGQVTFLQSKLVEQASETAKATERLDDLTCQMEALVEDVQGLVEWVTEPEKGD